MVKAKIYIETFLFFTLLITPSLVSASTVYQYFTNSSFYNNNFTGQEFNPPFDIQEDAGILMDPNTDYGLASIIHLAMGRFGSPTDEVYLEVYESDGSSLGSLLATSINSFSSGDVVYDWSQFYDTSNPSCPELNVSTGTTLTEDCFGNAFVLDTPVQLNQQLAFVLKRTSSRDNSNTFFFISRSGGASSSGENDRIQCEKTGSSCTTTGHDAFIYIEEVDIPAPYYAKIKGTSTGTWALRAASSTSSQIMKTLPEDWIVYVASSTSATGTPVVADGYRWYQVIDPTDNVLGWIAGENASGTVEYLLYDASAQTEFASTSDDYIATSSRPDLILDAVDHYYNNASTTYSLFSSDDGDNDISILKDNGYEEKVIWGIAAQESGGISFDNQYVSSDYGHGIMQITFSPSHWDNRGIGSRVTIPPCEAVSSSDYTNCYAGTNPKYYQSYGGNPSNSTYKQYTNTEQSIYSNIKDGMKVLQYKYGNFYPIATSTTVNGTTYSAVERENILVTEGYNGACGYVEDVADRLEEIDVFFPTATSSDITTLIQKMQTAGNEVICAQLHSPANLTIQDENGKSLGIMGNGKMQNDFPLALYDKNEKRAKILSPTSKNYSYRVIGLANGVYGLDVVFKNGDKELVFKSTNITTKPGEVHTYNVDKDKLMKSDPESVSISVDEDGDGKTDRVVKVGVDISNRQL